MSKIEIELEAMIEGNTPKVLATEWVTISNSKSKTGLPTLRSKQGGDDYQGVALGGRGQTGVAGFYGNYLIKQDAYYTCIIESSAYFAQDYIPKDFKRCVNFARLGKLYDAPASKTFRLISVQQCLKKSKPLDKGIYGKKREAKTLLSTEFSQRHQIRAYWLQQALLTKISMAAAAYISGFVGDESLHLGQYMVDEQGYIIRIDLGARERYAIARQRNHDIHVTKTSNIYATSGQFGKDYLSFLLLDPQVRTYYLQLWARQLDLASISDSAVTTLMDSIRQLPDGYRSDALRDVFREVYAKSMKINIDAITDGDIQAHINDAVYSRLSNYQQQARKTIIDELTEAYDAFQHTVKCHNSGDSGINDILSIMAEMKKIIIGKKAADHPSGVKAVYQSVINVLKQKASVLLGGDVVHCYHFYAVLLHFTAYLRWQISDGQLNALALEPLESSVECFRYRLLYAEYIDKSAKEKAGLVNQGLDILKDCDPTSNEVAQTVAQLNCNQFVINAICPAVNLGEKVEAIWDGLTSQLTFKARDTSAFHKSQSLSSLNVGPLKKNRRNRSGSDFWSPSEQSKVNDEIEENWVVVDSSERQVLDDDENLLVTIPTKNSN